jgi:hypothetical protein
MSSGLDQQLAAAEAAGYRLIVRHQPAVSVEPENWVILILTPDGRTLYPPAVDDDELGARARAASRVAQDLAERQRSNG